jgi:hypothetical protein
MLRIIPKNGRGASSDAPNTRATNQIVAGGIDHGLFALLGPIDEIVRRENEQPPAAPPTEETHSSDSPNIKKRKSAIAAALARWREEEQTKPTTLASSDSDAPLVVEKPETISSHAGILRVTGFEVVATTAGNQTPTENPTPPASPAPEISAIPTSALRDAIENPDWIKAAEQETQIGGPITAPPPIPSPPSTAGVSSMWASGAPHLIDKNDSPKTSLSGSDPIAIAPARVPSELTTDPESTTASSVEDEESSASSSDERDQPEHGTDDDAYDDLFSSSGRFEHF